MKYIQENVPKIGILLCTHNGEKYLHEQLNSILNQSFTNWKIYASDDSSQDATISILEKFKNANGEKFIEIINGPNKGATQNFISLVHKYNNDCDYFAFCDQDDIWEKDKLQIAFSAIDRFQGKIPAMYCSASKYISVDGKYLQNSFIFKSSPSFQNALVQSIAGGNTMLFNHLAAKLLAKTPINNTLIAHDWWLYILITAYNGYVYYDSIPQINYRQHSGVLVGENRTLKAKLARIRKLLNDRYRLWNDENLRLLFLFQSEISNQNLVTLKFFSLMKSKKISARLSAFFKSGIRRQTLPGNIALFIALILRKV